jgi:predicted Zn-dependent protease
MKAVHALLALALAAPPVLAATSMPFTGADTVRPGDDDEKRVWGAGDDFDQALRRSGKLVDDPKLTAYVQGVMDRLFPEFQGRIRVRLVRAPQINAFCLPNGSIYVNMGLLARFQNEAQLATVLAHEGIHFVNRHGYHQQQNIRSTAAAAMVIGMLGAAVGGGALGSLGQALTLSSIFGYSQDLETEADNEGYKRVIAAGYDPRETPKVFQHLMDELKVSDVKEPFFFSTHPKLQDRVDNFTRLSANATPPPADSAAPDRYPETVATVRLLNLQNELALGRYRQVLLALDDRERRAEYPPYVVYYLGEAYRLRGRPGDEERMEQSYLQAIDAAPDFAPPYRALGAHFLKKGAWEEAAKQLERYLQLAPDASDKAYAEQYLALARKRAQAQ